VKTFKQFLAESVTLTGQALKILMKDGTVGIDVSKGLGWWRGDIISVAESGGEWWLS